MAHYSYIAVTVEQNRAESIFGPASETYAPGFYSYVLMVSESDNLLSRLSSIGGLKQASVCTTKKKASEIAECWNACHKANGQYLFDCPAF